MRKITELICYTAKRPGANQNRKMVQKTGVVKNVYKVLKNFDSNKKVAQTVLRGDTLVEAMFAIAAFCAISVSTIVLMNSSYGKAQGTLQATMVRNEMNAQAEAIRFVHESYVAEKNLGGSSSTMYRDLWDSMTDRAEQNKVNTVSGSCSEAYKDGGEVYSNSVFVLNTRTLSNSGVGGTTILTAGYNTVGSFTAAPVYSRILMSRYGKDSGGELVENYTNLSKAEGIWDFAVASDSEDDDGTPFYYDFYIRTCWNSSGDNSFNTRDTVVRLYNPDADLSQAAQGGVDQDFRVYYDINGGNNGNGTPTYDHQTSRADDPSVNTTNAVPTKNTGTCPAGTSLAGQNCRYVFLGWDTKQHDVASDYNTYGPTGGSSVHVQCAKGQENCKINASGGDVQMYAVWWPVLYSDFQMTLRWGASPRDLDSHLKWGTNELYYGRKTITGTNLTVNLDIDKTSGYGPEVVTLRGTSAKSGTYYYYIYNYTGSPSISNSGATVTLNIGEDDSERTYTVPSGSGRYWNVFKIVNGTIVNRNTITDSADTNY